MQWEGMWAWGRRRAVVDVHYPYTYTLSTAHECSKGLLWLLCAARLCRRMVVHERNNSTYAEDGTVRGYLQPPKRLSTKLASRQARQALDSQSPEWQTRILAGTG
jgi:hypothetical protein